MKTEATLVVVGIVILLTILYVIDRIMLGALLNAKKERKNRKKKGNSAQRDRIRERRWMQSIERDTPRYTREKPMATFYYALAMFGCVVLLVLIHTLL